MFLDNTFVHFHSHSKRYGQYNEMGINNSLVPLTVDLALHVQVLSNNTFFSTFRVRMDLTKANLDRLDNDGLWYTVSDHCSS